MGEEWNNLIILDACRYDFFEKVYQDYLHGKLEKRESQGSCTMEWLTKNFTAKYDITYISANPYINSHGVPLNEFRSHHSNPWKATEHFTRIIDTWKTGWDNELKTIPPEAVNRACLAIPSNGRKIIHYIQPHAPYLSPMSMALAEQPMNIANSRDTAMLADSRPNEGFLLPLARFLKVGRVIGKQNIWRVAKMLGMPPRTPFEAIWRDKGQDIGKLRYYYEDNLRKALVCIMQLMSHLKGITVITADHGEMLGEGGKYGHSPNKRIPVLIEVPWLRIESNGNT
jgi:hypothetical protein